MTKFKTHIYKPNAGALRITIEPSRPIHQDGMRVGDTRGKYAHFVGGVFETDDKEVIEYLRKLPSFGVDFFEVPENEEPAQSSQNSGPNLESLTKKELVEHAKGKGIEVDESLTKAELVERLKGK